MEGKQTSEVIKANTQDHTPKIMVIKEQRAERRGEKKERKEIQRKQSKFFSSENSLLKLPISIRTLCKEPDTQLFSQTLRMSLPPDVTPKPPL